MNKLKLTVIVFSTLAIMLSCCSDNQEVQTVDKIADDFVKQAKANITEISLSDFFELYTSGEYYLIDVRTQSEHNSGYIPGSVSIPRGVIEFRIDNEAFWDNEGLYMPLKEEALIVYCKKGSRAAMVANILQQMGYKNVKSIAGGWLKWKETYPDQIDTALPEGGSDSHADEGGC